MDNQFLKDLGLDLDKNPELQKLYYEEKLIFDATETISQAMEARKINKTELAKQLGITKSAITHFLDGSHNMTLRTVADILFALDSRLVVKAVPLAFQARAHEAVWHHQEPALSTKPVSKTMGWYKRTRITGKLTLRLAG